MILIDTNILLRSVQTSDPHYPLAENALTALRRRGEILCLAPQNLIEFWSVATRPQNENGLGLDTLRASKELTSLTRLFTVLPYKPEVLEIGGASFRCNKFQGSKPMTRIWWQ